MDRYAQILCSLLDRHPARLSIATATRLLLGRGKVYGYALARAGRFPVPVLGGGRGEPQYVRLQDVARFFADEAPSPSQITSVAYQPSPHLPQQNEEKRRVGRPTKAETERRQRIALAGRESAE